MPSDSTYCSQNINIDKYLKIMTLAAYAENYRKLERALFMCSSCKQKNIHSKAEQGKLRRRTFHSGAPERMMLDRSVEIIYAYLSGSCPALTPLIPDRTLWGKRDQKF